MAHFWIRIFHQVRPSLGPLNCKGQLKLCGLHKPQRSFVNCWGEAEQRKGKGCFLHTYPVSTLCCAREKKLLSRSYLGDAFARQKEVESHTFQSGAEETRCTVIETLSIIVEAVWQYRTASIRHTLESRISTHKLYLKINENSYP